MAVHAYFNRPSAACLLLAACTIGCGDSDPSGGSAGGAPTLRVGPERGYKRPSDAAAVARDGDVIEIDAGTYSRDVAIWRANNLVIRGGPGGRPHLRADGAEAEDKGIWVIKGANTTVENIEFSGASVRDQNGAGIRHEGRGLVVRNCFFHDNENGILTGNDAESEVLVEFSEFARNGYGDGLSHNIYVGRARSLRFQHNYTHSSRIGHNLKSRARTTYVLYNRITDEADGTGSYAIDVSEGGLTYIVGNLVQQGPGSENSGMIAYALENPIHPIQELFVVNNTFVNDRPGAGRFLDVAATTTNAQIVNNVFVGRNTSIFGPVTLRNNISDADGRLRNRAAFDYRLLPDSPAVDAGEAPGADRGFDLTPVWQYAHPANRERRTTTGRGIDAGAYEVSN